MLQEVLDTIPARVFWKDTTSRYLGCNNKFAKDAGLSKPEEIIGKTDNDLIWKKSAKKFIKTAQVSGKRAEKDIRIVVS